MPKINLSIKDGNLAIHDRRNIDEFLEVRVYTSRPSFNSYALLQRRLDEGNCIIIPLQNTFQKHLPLCAVIFFEMMAWNHFPKPIMTGLNANRHHYWHIHLIIWYHKIVFVIIFANELWYYLSATCDKIYAFYVTKIAEAFLFSWYLACFEIFNFL